MSQSLTWLDSDLSQSVLPGQILTCRSLSLGRFAAALAAPAVGAAPTFGAAELALQASPPAARAALSAASFAAQPAVAPASPRLAQQGAVLMVYGLNKDMMNAERLFNLFCLYGNVIRVGCGRQRPELLLAPERTVWSYVTDFMKSGRIWLLGLGPSLLR